MATNKAHAARLAGLGAMARGRKDDDRQISARAGEPLPWFRAKAIGGSDNYVFDTAAGRYILMLFFGRAAIPPPPRRWPASSGTGPCSTTNFGLLLRDHLGSR